jgi:hypothetical protein
MEDHNLHRYKVLSLRWKDFAPPSTGNTTVYSIEEMIGQLRTYHRSSIVHKMSRLEIPHIHISLGSALELDRGTNNVQTMLATSNEDVLR